MQFISGSASPIVIKANIKGAAPATVADFKLYLIAPDGTGTQIAAEGNPTTASAVSRFTVPAQGIGTTATLRLDTTPASMGASNADVFLTATQNGVDLPNQQPTAGKSSDWLETLTKDGVKIGQTFSIVY